MTDANEDATEPSDSRIWGIDPDYERFLQTPMAIILASWACFILLMSWFILGDDLVDWMLACLILATSILIQIPVRLIWWTVIILSGSAFVWLLMKAVYCFTQPATSFEQTVALLSVLFAAIIVVLLLLPTSRSYYREASEDDS